MSGAHRLGQALFAALVLALLGTSVGCRFHATRQVVADPASVAARNDAYWKVRPRPNVSCEPPGGP